VRRFPDVTWSRVAVLVGLLAVGLVLVHVAGRGKPRVSQEQAVAIARTRVDFQPKAHQIRFVRRGIPPHGYWVVSFYIPKRGGGYTRVTDVLVDATTGTVTEVTRVT
jgi:hypothetical protein